MKILCALYYYYPYISGLSIYCRKLAEQMAVRGHEVSIITSKYDPDLDPLEVVNGVRVIRVPVWFGLDKGVIMPSFVPKILQLGRKADIVNLHLPMAEASLITMALPRKTVLTYQCQLRLNSRTFAGRLMEKLINMSQRLAVRRAATTVSTSFDYAANDTVLGELLEKVTVIAPPIDPVKSDAAPAIRPDYFNYRADVPHGAKTIGFLGRIVYEKGIDFLIHAFSDLQKKHDDLYLIIAGDYRGVAGGSVKNQLMRYLSTQDNRIRFTGRLNDLEVDAFLRFIDVLALPSIHGLEAYGMVQVEAMLRGSPVVATDLPGVRTVVQRTGMGKIVPNRDPHALAIAIEQVVFERDYTTLPPEEIFRLLDLGTTTESYEELFEEIHNPKPIGEPNG